MEPTRLLLREPWPLMGMHGRNPTQGGGWTVLTVEHGDNPHHTGGGDFRDVREKGRVPIVRLNKGYGKAGTIPIPERYDEGSHRAAKYVEASKGCDVWIVGNEWNTSWERPERPDGTRPPILPEQYAAYYSLVWERIHEIPGHEMDIVLFAPVGPWNPETTYPGNERGDWLRTYQDAQAATTTPIDGFAWHAYSRQQVPGRLSSHFYMTQPGWGDHHWEFRVFEDWNRATLAKHRGAYKFLTEFDANEPWLDENRGFFGAAAQEVFVWNKNRDAGDAAIQALVAYRWEFDKWYIKGRHNLIADYHEAVARNLTAPAYLDPTVPPIDPPPPPPPGNTWTLQGTLTGPDGQAYKLEGSIIREEAK